MTGFPVLASTALSLLMLPAATAAADRVPPVHGTTLAGQEVTLPDALRGRPGVLVIGFTQGSREQVTAWGRRLGADYFDSPQVSYYEMAMLAEVPRLLRGWVTRKIREGVSARGQQHFLPIADHEDEWKLAAEYKEPDAAYVLVVDGRGTIVYRLQGALSDASYAELQRRLLTASK